MHYTSRCRGLHSSTRRSAQNRSFGTRARLSSQVSLFVESSLCFLTFVPSDTMSYLGIQIKSRALVAEQIAEETVDEHEEEATQRILGSFPSISRSSQTREERTTCVRMIMAATIFCTRSLFLSNPLPSWMECHHHHHG